MLRGLVRAVFIAGIAVSCAGCRDSANPAPVKTNELPALATSASNHISETVRKTATGSTAVDRTLEDIHKEYLAAYERYVKMLRESGPQTMETLGALAEYQRKYQTYQLLLGDSKSSR